MNFSMMEVFKKNTRKQAIDQLLKPITWSAGSSVTSRQKLVHKRHEQLAFAYPFMNEYEKNEAIAWFVKERHNDLWD